MAGAAIDLSVVTVTYNDAKGLASTITSLVPLLSSSFSWEHVVVDGSPAINSTVLQELPQNWPLKHITQEPQGVYAAMNVGIEKSSGKILWFLNGGDCLLDMLLLEKVIESFQKNESIDLFGVGASFFRDGSFLYNDFPNDSLRSNLLGRNYLCHQGLFYRSSLFSTVGLFSLNYRIAGDYEHHIRMYLSGVKFLALEKPLVRLERGGISDSIPLSIRERSLIFSEFKDKFCFRDLIRHCLFSTIEIARLQLIGLLRKLPCFSRLRHIWIQWKRQ